MAKETAATGLIIALARKKAAKAKASGDDDYKACAKGILAAIKSGSESDLASALKSLNEVSQSHGD